MPDYSALQDTAARLVTAYGRSVTLRRVARTAGATPWDPTESATDYSITAVEESFRAEQRDGSVVEANDQKFLVAADGLAIEPEPDDEIVDGSVVWKIISVETVAPGDATILHKVHVRK